MSTEGHEPETRTWKPVNEAGKGMMGGDGGDALGGGGDGDGGGGDVRDHQNGGGFGTGGGGGGSGLGGGGASPAQIHRSHVEHGPLFAPALYLRRPPSK